MVLLSTGLSAIYMLTNQLNDFIGQCQPLCASKQSADSCDANAVLRGCYVHGTKHAAWAYHILEDGNITGPTVKDLEEG
jgi:hypothetical protein